MISLLFHVVRLLLRKTTQTWWRHQMETFSALLAICAGNTPVPVNSLHKGQWRGAFMLSLVCAWINLWVNNREADDLRRYCAHYVIVMNLIDSIKVKPCHTWCLPFDTFKRFITWWRHQMETFPRHWPFCAEITGHYDVTAMSLNRQYFFTKGNVWSIADKWIRRSIEKLHPFFLVISSMEQQPLPNDWTALCFATFSFELTQFNTVIP